METHQFWAFFVIALIAGGAITLAISNATMTGSAVTAINEKTQPWYQRFIIPTPQPTEPEVTPKEVIPEEVVGEKKIGIEAIGTEIGVLAKIAGEEAKGEGVLAQASWGWGFTGVRGATREGDSPSSIGVAGSAYCDRDSAGECTGMMAEWWTPEVSVSAKLGYKDSRGDAWAGYFNGPVKLPSSSVYLGDHELYLKHTANGLPKLCIKTKGMCRTKRETKTITEDVSDHTYDYACIETAPNTPYDGGGCGHHAREKCRKTKKTLKASNLKTCSGAADCEASGTPVGEVWFDCTKEKWLKVYCTPHVKCEWSCEVTSEYFDPASTEFRCVTLTEEF